jgi:membrane protease YdiL (CAAX protease family)
MSLLVWLARQLLARTAPVSSGAAWIGIVGAAVLFGMGHLPAAAVQWPLTTMVVMRIVMLNAAGGIVFGWLYWRRGLAHSMAAHFFADVVLHGIGGG